MISTACCASWHTQEASACGSVGTRIALGHRTQCHRTVQGPEPVVVAGRGHRARCARWCSRGKVCQNCTTTAIEAQTSSRCRQFCWPSPRSRLCAGTSRCSQCAEHTGSRAAQHLAGPLLVLVIAMAAAVAVAVADVMGRQSKTQARDGVT